MPDLAVADQGSGPAAVLLHGQPGEGRDWNRVTRRLQDRMRVIVPDRPGYGRTTRPAAGMAANADVIVDLLDGLGLDEAVVVGHSWGGGVALSMAQRHPDRVAALVLAGSIGGLGSVVRLDRVLTAPVFGPGMALAGIVALTVPRVLARPRPESLSPSVSPSPSPSVSPSSSPDGFRTGWYRAWRSFVVEQRALVDEMPGIAARLGTVRAPTLVVVGGADRVVRPGSQRDLAARLPGGQLVELEGVGHLLPRDVPDRLADLIALTAGPAPWRGFGSTQPRAVPLAADVPGHDEEDGRL